MNINEIFIINKGGVAVFYWNTGIEIFNKDLLSGLMASLNMIATELTGDELKTLAVSNRQYNFYSYDFFTLVIHSDASCCPIEMARIAAEIGYKFGQKYNTVVERAVNLKQFDPFSEELAKILPITNTKSNKMKVKSSEALENFLGIAKGKINMKRVLENL